MNTSRFEVPLTLPPPHFDDERTIATARQVEPIGRAKVTDGWRKLRALLPIILLATLCGGLGAAGVNYYERNRNAEAPAPQQASVSNPAPAQVKNEAAPVTIASATETSKTIAAETAVDEKQDSTEAKPEPAKPETEAKPAKPEKKNTDADAAKLTRKRRVTDGSARDKNGAGHIADIFGGPNP